MIVNSLVPVWLVPAPVPLVFTSWLPSFSASEPCVSLDVVFDLDGTALKRELWSLGVSSDESGYCMGMIFRIEDLRVNGIVS